MRTLLFRWSVFILALVLLAQVHGIAQEPASRVLAVIGIPAEVAPIEAKLATPIVTRVNGFVFTSGSIEGIRIVAARSGMGKVDAAIVATLLLDHFAPRAVLWTGTAGALDRSLNPGDVVIGTAVGYHDFGSITDRGFNRSPTRNPDAGQIDPLFFPAAPELLAAARRAAKTVQLSRAPQSNGETPRIREGLIVTGDAIVSAAGYRKDLRSDLNAAAVEMEGAAVAQVCARYNVPVIVIRGITDRADSQARNSYRQFLETAAGNAAGLTLATIQEFVKQR